MNKKELIDFIFEHQQKKVPKKIIGDVIESFVEAIADAIKQQEPIKLVGFFNINFKTYNQRQVRNPKTGAIHTSPTTIKPVIKLSKDIIPVVNVK